MGTEVWSGPLGEIRGAGTSGGTSLTTTAAFIQFRLSAKHLFVTPRNFSTAVVARIALNPWLVIFTTTDSLVAAGNIADYSNNAQDNDTGTSVTLSSLDTAVNGDFIYVGSHLPFRGADIDVDAPNGTASVLTVNYWDGTAWADTSATDGTASGGATFAVDGTVTWAVPTDCVKDNLIAIGDTSLSAAFLTVPMYWTRWQVSVALDASVTLDHMLAMNRDTNYFELIEGQLLEKVINVGPDGVGCLEALVDAGTANLVVNVATRGPIGSFV